MGAILIPVDAANPARMAAAVAEAIRICSHHPVAVHLLNVQPAVTGHVAMFFGAGELQQLHMSAGEEALAPARALLERNGVAYSASVRVGRAAPTIASAARDLGCDRIVLGRGGAEVSLGGKVFGSLGQQLRQLMRAGGSFQVIGA